MKTASERPDPRVGHARRVELAVGQKAHGEGEEDVLGAGAGRGGVGVEVLQRHTVGVLVGLRLGPVDEVLGGATLDGPHPAALGLEVAAEEAVTPDVGIPQGDVEGVEGAGHLQGALPHRGPEQAVGGGEAVQVRPARAANGLEALLRVGVRVGVEEDAEVVALVALDEDVVPARARELHQAQLRVLEADAVAADRQIGGLAGGAVGVVLADGVEAPVVEQDPVAVLDQVVAGGAGALPGLGDLEDHLPALRRVQAQGGPLEAVHEKAVDEQLPAGAEGWRARSWHTFRLNQLPQRKDEAMPFINVKMLEGRTTDQKRDLAKALTDAIVEICGAKREGTMVVIEDHAKEDWAVGGVTIADRG